MPLRPLLFVFLCALLLSAAPQAFAASHPALGSLALVQQGIDERNSDLVTQTLDIGAVVDKASDALVAALRDQGAQGTLGDSNLALALSFAALAEDSGQTALLKPLLISEVKGFVAAGVNGGYFAGTPDPSIKRSKGSLAGALDKLSPGRRQVIPGKVLSETTDTAVVSATFVDPKAGRLPLELAMEQRDGRWRVVEILNAKTLFGEAARRAKP